MAERALYDEDFHAWTVEQAAALRRAGQARVNTPQAVDWQNVAEEVEGMGRSQKSAIRSALTSLLEHLLKLAYSPDRPPRAGWKRSAYNARYLIADEIADSPSLAGYPAAVLATCYARARKAAAGDPSVAPLPDACPFDLDTQVLAEDWFPEPS